jgi:hypothetical protein
VSLLFDERSSDSPFVEKIWRIENDRVLPFLSVTKPHLMLLFGREHGKLTVSLRGPETKATAAHTPSDAEFLGIFLKLGVFIPSLPAAAVVDGQLDLPQLSRASLWLNGRSWEVPTFDNADNFVAALARDGLLVQDGVVGAALREESTRLSSRSLQRRILRATGLTHGTIAQILRAQDTARLLRRGVPVLDAVEDTGYYDQPHLTKALRRFFGQTPSQTTRTPAATSIF